MNLEVESFAGELRQFALEAADPGFASIVTDDTTNGGIGHREFAVFQAVSLELPPQQMAFRDFQLLVLGIARQPDDLHPVEKRLRHVQRVRGGDEQHVRQVEIQFHVMVLEGVVLRRVANLQQS